MSAEEPTAVTASVNEIVSRLSQPAKDVLKRVIALEQAKLHMSIPTGIIEDIKNAIAETIK